MGQINPFRIAVPDADLNDLRMRLVQTRWPEAECVDDWSQGIPLDYTRELAGYWATSTTGAHVRRHSTGLTSTPPKSTGSTSISSTSDPARATPSRC